MPTRGFTHPGSRRVSHYDPTLSTAYATGSLWQDCPLLEYIHDQSIGVLLDERWQGFNTVSTTGDWVSTQATSGTAAIDTTAPGRLKIDAGATTSGQGMNLQRTKSAFIPASGKDLWAEFKVLLTASTPPVTKAQLFVGLAASDTTIIASGSQTTNNRIGWQIQTGENLALTFTVDKAGTGTTATGATLTAATAIRLGFKYDGTADTIQQYINGVATGSAIATTYIPKLVVYPSLVCQSDGTDQPVLYVSPFRVFQLS